MFLTLNRGYIGEGEEGEDFGGEFAEGTLLLIAEDPAALTSTSRPQLRALAIEDVRLEQLGHFMMGQVKLEQDGDSLGEITLSGPFGGDGLPVHLSHKQGIYANELWDAMHPIPKRIQNAFWDEKNEKVRDWALKNLDNLIEWVPLED